MCQEIRDNGGFVQLTSFYDDELWFMIVSLFSALLGAFFFFLVFRFESLQAHPMQILSSIWLSTSIFQMNVLFSERICDF